MQQLEEKVEEDGEALEEVTAKLQNKTEKNEQMALELKKVLESLPCRSDLPRRVIEKCGHVFRQFVFQPRPHS